MNMKSLSLSLLVLFSSLAFVVAAAIFQIALLLIPGITACVFAQALTEE